MTLFILDRSFGERIQIDATAIIRQLLFGIMDLKTVTLFFGGKNG